MTDQPVPKWIIYYLWFVSIISAVFAIVIYVNPAASFEEIHGVGRATNFCPVD